MCMCIKALGQYGYALIMAFERHMYELLCFLCALFYLLLTISKLFCRKNISRYAGLTWACTYSINPIVQELMV